jgi:hypothetical protein
MYYFFCCTCPNPDFFLFFSCADPEKEKQTQYFFNSGCSFLGKCPFANKYPTAIDYGLISPAASPTDTLKRKGKSFEGTARTRETAFGNTDPDATKFLG